MRTIALTALLLAAVPWPGMDQAVARWTRGAHAPHVNSGTYHRGSKATTEAGNRRRYAPANHVRWHPQAPTKTQTPTRYGANEVAPPPKGDGPPRHPLPPHWPPRWPRPPIATHPINPTGGTVIVNLPPRLPISNGPVGDPNVGVAIGPPGQAGGSRGGNNRNNNNTSVTVTDQRFVPDEILVRFNGGVSPAAITNFTRSQLLAPLGAHPLPLINATLYRYRITDRRSVPAVLDGLRGDGRLAAAQPNYLYELRDDGTREDGAPVQYDLSTMHHQQAHALARGTGVLIALIDAGVDTPLAELRGSVSQGTDTVGGELAPHAHGTAMASAIVAHGRLLGVAPAARIVAVRAFDGGNAGARATTVRLLDGLQWSATSGARVINMSFTGPADAQLETMIAAVHRKGLVLVAAAGNDGPTSPPDYPAAYPGVIAVTATDIDDHLLRVANHGSYVAVAAPGVDISVAAPNGGYSFTTGTSVAAAHVSGLVALLLERNPRLTPDAVAAILMQTAKDLGPKGRDDEFGAGLVDAYAAVLTQASASAAR